MNTKFTTDMDETSPDKTLQNIEETISDSDSSNYDEPPKEKKSQKIVESRKSPERKVEGSN